MASRISGLPIAIKTEEDDYLALDGATNNSRKILVSDLSGTVFDFASSITPSISSDGTSYTDFIVTPSDTTVLTDANVLEIGMYLSSSSTNYQLIIVKGEAQTNRFVLSAKSINSSTQSTTSPTVSGTLHAVAPFEIASVSYYK